jgi:hypothetical protein
MKSKIKFILTIIAFIVIGVLIYEYSTMGKSCEIGEDDAPMTAIEKHYHDSVLNAQKKDSKVENNIEKETTEFLSKNKSEQIVKLGNIVEIRVLNQKSSFGTDIVWKNKSTCKLVKQLESNYLSRKEGIEGGGGFAVLRFKTEKIGTENIIIDQCKVYPNNDYKNCLGEQNFSIKIIPNEVLSKEVPPNGTFIFTVKDFEANKTGKWKVVIKGNKATIYSLGKEIWDTTARKRDIISKINIIKYKGKWITVNDNELDKDFEVINGGQFETWDFKNKVIGTF